MRIVRWTCYKSYKPYCNSVMKKLGSEIKCDAMLSDVRPEFDCILNVHCPGKYQGCVQGQCERVVVKLNKVYNDHYTFNEDDWVMAKLPALPRKISFEKGKKGVVKLCLSEKSATVQVMYVKYGPLFLFIPHYVPIIDNEVSLLEGWCVHCTREC